MDDWVITLPKKIEWADYEKELEAVKSGRNCLNYRLPFTPKIELGARCFLCWRGKVRGWMRVTGIDNRLAGFKCQTTGKMWPPGTYIQRSGEFYKVEGPAMKGFQGIRRIKGMGGLTPRTECTRIGEARFDGKKPIGHVTLGGNVVTYHKRSEGI